MPPRLDENEKSVVASFTVLPQHKQFLDDRARQLSLRLNVFVSASTIVRTLIEQYIEKVTNDEKQS